MSNDTLLEVRDQFRLFPQKAQRMIAGCEAFSEDAELPFENILDRLTVSGPSVTDYVRRHQYL